MQKHRKGSGKPRGGRPRGRRDGPRSRDRRRPQRRLREVKGRVGALGLDGKLRVHLGPLELATVSELKRRGGAEVVTTRNDAVGRVETVVGTLGRPIAIVRLHPEARRGADRLMGKEVFLG